MDLQPPHAHGGRVERHPEGPRSVEVSGGLAHPPAAVGRAASGVDADRTAPWGTPEHGTVP
ncbi:MAG: hypothetical protein M3R63_10635 [Actinomycetota bacterium]|nr:hypothetical protein [Actinomycetota bacterium]